MSPLVTVIVFIGAAALVVWQWARTRQLTRIPVLNEYWFDWKTYNPKTLVYNLGDK